MNRKNLLLSPLGAFLALTIGVAALIAGGGHATPAKADAATNGAFDFGSATYSVAEGGTVYIVVNRSQGSAGTETVQYSLVFNSPAVAADLNGFSPAPGFLTFNPGETSRTIDAGAQGSGITTVDNHVVEATKTVSFTITGVTGGGTIGVTQPSTTLSITDVDSPGITVTPTSGLTTSESGTQASFTVRLNTQPSASVTIGLSSSDTTEGTVSPTSLTFTTSDWSTPKTVTVTGVADGLADGNQPFTIITAPAVSADANYNNFNASNVSVTNLDINGVSPIISYVTPASGQVGGGNQVTIVGTNLLGATVVTFAGQSASIVGSSTATTITVVVPAYFTPGAVTVAATVTAGSTSLAAAYTYTSGFGPTISYVTPASGQLGGGNQVTIVGTNLLGATVVTFAGQSAAIVGSSTATTITVVVPAYFTPGAITVAVTVTAGSTSLAGAYTYGSGSGIPVISSVSPTTGPTSGLTYFTITGANFTGANIYGLTFGGTQVTSFTVSVDGTTITGYTPAHAAGLVQVVVRNAVGPSVDAGTIDDYTYTGASPLVSYLSPTSGPAAGGTTVVITGSGFTGATGVSFGTTTASSFTVNSDTQITVSSPAQAAGTVSVFVIVGTVTSPEVGTGDNFTYTGAGGHYTYALSFRWSLIVWVGADSAPVQAALSGTLSSGDSLTNNVFSTVTAVFSWNASGQRWLAFFPSGVNVPGANDFTSFTRYGAYWIAVSTGTSWTVATP